MEGEEGRPSCWNQSGSPEDWQNMWDIVFPCWWDKLQNFKRLKQLIQPPHTLPQGFHKHRMVKQDNPRLLRKYSGISVGSWLLQEMLMFFFLTQRTKPSSLICKPEFVTTSIDLQFFLHLERSVCETSHRINALITFHHGHFTCVVCLQQALQQPLSHPLVVSSTDGHEVNKLFQPSEMVTRLVWCVGKNGCLMLFVV